MDLITLIQDGFETFLQSYTFAALKIFFIIYSIILILDIILLLSFRDISGILKQGKYGTALMPSLSQSAMRKKWKTLEDRLASGNPSEYKVAILEADLIVEQILTDIGYDSKTDMGQKIEQLRVTQPEDADTIDRVHQLRNRIVFEENFEVSLDEARDALETYKNYLKKHDYFA